MTGSAIVREPGATADDVPGDRYKLLETLGEGSFSRVHRALDTVTGRSVAIKVLQAATNDDPPSVLRRAEKFRRESSLCRELHHPGIVALLDLGTTSSGLPYAVFELVEGRTLRELLDEGMLSPALALRLSVEVLDALAAAHARGVVHRDLKPENILVTATGVLPRAVIVDFGFGSADEGVGGFEGTPQYAAPEQARGEAATPRSDLYSWGLILLECLSGHSAIASESAHEAWIEQLGAQAVAIPQAIDALPIASLIRRVTSKDPSARPASAADALGELARLVPDAGSFAHDVPRDPVGLRSRQVTVVSCRIHAPRDAATVEDDTLRAETVACMEFFAGRGGSVISAVGDRVVIVFGLLRRTDEDACRAADAASDWLDRRPPIGAPPRPRWSIGIHAGSVLVDEAPSPSRPPAGLLGALGATAQQLDAVARPSRIVVSAATAALLGNRWSFAPASAGDQQAWHLRRRRTPMGEPEGSAQESTFIGRDDESRILATAWQRALAGEPQALLLQGEAGIGKSRLLAEFRRSAGNVEWIAANGAEQYQARPFGTLAQLLSRLGARSTQLASRYGLDPAESVPILASLLGEPTTSGYALPLVTPDRYKELTLQVATRVFLGVAADEALVIAVEDLQWADTGTLEFLDVLLRHARADAVANPQPLLLLLTAAADFHGPWSDADVTTVPLHGLPADDVTAWIREVTGVVDSALLERLVRASRGVPLLAEEAAHLLSSRTGGATSADSSADSADELLMARLSALSPAALATAQTAAAIGQEFAPALVLAAAALDETDVRETLDELVAANIVVRGGAPDSLLRFRHSLLRNAAYGSIAEVAPLHRRIAETIRRKFPSLAIERPGELALHYERCGEAMAAAELWHQAGTGAMTTAAYLDARKHFARGIALIEGVPDSPLRAQRALALTTALATAHLSTQGFGSAETREAFGRARVMCTRLGREAPLEVVGGIFGAALANADNDETEAILPLFRSLADRSENPLYAFAGHQVLGVHACWSGRYALAHRHTTTAMELYRRKSVRGISWEFGFGLYCYAYGMMAEFQRGFADRAERVRLEMMELAEKSGNPYCLALALGFSTTLTSDLGRPEQTIEHATRLLAIASEQHLYLWSAFAMCAQGGALVQLGRAAEGLAPIRGGVALLDMLGFRCSYGYYLMFLVEALTACGETDEALVVADEALALYAAHWTRFPEPNMIRLRGVVLETRGDDEGAEQQYRRGLQVAAADEALSFELRAATSLARLLSRRGDKAGAVAELSRVRGGFREGFETSDLRAADELLGSLVRAS